MNYVQKLCLSIAMVISFSNFGMMQQVVRYDNGFKVYDGKQEKHVRPCFVDPLLRSMNAEQLKKFVDQDNHIRAIRLSDGEHRLQAMVPGNGGGPIGAAVGVTVGFAAVQGAAYGTIGLVSTLFGPAAPFVAATASAVLTPAITAASHVAAIGFGIALAVAKGENALFILA